MFEYEVEVTVEDKDKVQHITKRYYVLPIMGKDQLKDKIDDLLSKDIDIIKYSRLIGYDVTNWGDIN